MHCKSRFPTLSKRTTPYVAKGSQEGSHERDDWGNAKALLHFSLMTLDKKSKKAFFGRQHFDSQVVLLDKQKEVNALSFVYVQGYLRISMAIAREICLSVLERVLLSARCF